MRGKNPTTTQNNWNGLAVTGHNTMSTTTKEYPENPTLQCYRQRGKQGISMTSVRTWTGINMPMLLSEAEDRVRRRSISSCINCDPQQHCWRWHAGLELEFLSMWLWGQVQMYVFFSTYCDNSQYTNMPSLVMIKQIKSWENCNKVFTHTHIYI